jgi:hypothetical protein
MGRHVGMGILRLLSVILAVTGLVLIVLTAGVTFFFGTKVGRFTPPASALAGEPDGPGPHTPKTMSQFLGRTPDAGTGAGVDAGSAPAPVPPGSEDGAR